MVVRMCVWIVDIVRLINGRFGYDLLADLERGSPKPKYSKQNRMMHLCWRFTRFGLILRLVAVIRVVIPLGAQIFLHGNLICLLEEVRRKIGAGSIVDRTFCLLEQSKTIEATLPTILGIYPHLVTRKPPNPHIRGDGASKGGGGGWLFKSCLYHPK